MCIHISNMCVYNVTSFPAVPGASECLLSAILMSSLKGHSRDDSSSKSVPKNGGITTHLGSDKQKVGSDKS